MKFYTVSSQALWDHFQLRDYKVEEPSSPIAQISSSVLPWR